MSIYAIADLHLSFGEGVEKPMDIYGDRWYDHWKRLERAWKNEIKDNDTVIVPGDISWGLKLNEAKNDLDWVDNLPGHKVLFKGNHDLWWSGIKKLNSMYDTMTFMQNDCFFSEDVYICGTRGWITPDNDDFKTSDEKIYRREMLRLEASLKAALDMREATGKEGEILGVMHYPPVSKMASFSGFQQIFEDFGVKRVIYGHVHGEDGFRNTIMGIHHGIHYELVSLDYLNCRPLLIKP